MATHVPIVTACAPPGHQYPGEGPAYYPHAPPPTPLQPYHTQQAIIIDTADIRYGWRATRWNSWTDVLLNDGIAMICPCLSVGQLASSISMGFLAPLVVFAQFYVGGIASYTIGMTLKDPVYEWSRDIYPLLTAWAMYVFGPCATLAVAAYMAFFADIGSAFDYRGVRNRSDPNTISFVLVMIHAVAQIVQITMVVRLTQTHAMRANLPPRRLLTICCPTFSLAETVAHAKNHNKLGACHMGKLDELPAYYP